MTDADLTTRARELWPRRWKLAIDSLYVPQPPPITFPFGTKMTSLYNFVRDTLSDGPITYLEFGVFRGDSIRRMSKLFTHPDSRFVGFDSFEGLPEDWGANRPQGHFTTEGQIPLIPDSRVSFVKGYFQNTLPGFLATPRRNVPTLIHFDADLYSSTLFLLSMFWNELWNITLYLMNSFRMRR